MKINHNICKLEFAYRAQRFQVSAQAARFKKGKAHGVKMAAMFRGRPCLCEVFLTVLYVYRSKRVLNRAIVVWSLSGKLCTVVYRD